MDHLSYNRDFKTFQCDGKTVSWISRYGLWYCSSHFQSEQICQPCKLPRPSKSQSIFYPSSFITSIQKLHSALPTEQQLCWQMKYKNLLWWRWKKTQSKSKTNFFFTKKEIIRVKQIRIFTGSTNIWIALPFCVACDIISLVLCLAVTKPCTYSCRKQPMCCSDEL